MQPVCRMHILRCINSNLVAFISSWLNGTYEEREEGDDEGGGRGERERGNRGNKGGEEYGLNCERECNDSERRVKGKGSRTRETRGRTVVSGRGTGIERQRGRERIQFHGRLCSQSAGLLPVRVSVLRRWRDYLACIHPCGYARDARARARETSRNMRSNLCDIIYIYIYIYI